MLQKGRRSIYRKGLFSITLVCIPAEKLARSLFLQSKWYSRKISRIRNALHARSSGNILSKRVSLDLLYAAPSSTSALTTTGELVTHGRRARCTDDRVEYAGSAGTSRC